MQGRSNATVIPEGCTYSLAQVVRLDGGDLARQPRGLCLQLTHGRLQRGELAAQRALAHGDPHFEVLDPPVEPADLVGQRPAGGGDAPPRALVVPEQRVERPADAVEPDADWQQASGGMRAFLAYFEEIAKIRA
jgi:hypothetical protein